MSDTILHCRNTLYARIANWLASWLPTKEYTDYLRGAMEYGLRSSVRDASEGREAPPDWRVSEFRG